MAGGRPALLPGERRWVQRKGAHATAPDASSAPPLSGGFRPAPKQNVSVHANIAGLTFSRIRWDEAKSPAESIIYYWRKEDAALREGHLDCMLMLTSPPGFRARCATRPAARKFISLSATACLCRCVTRLAVGPPSWSCRHAGLEDYLTGGRLGAAPVSPLPVSPLPVSTQVPGEDRNWATIWLRLMAAFNQAG